MAKIIWKKNQKKSTQPVQTEIDQPVQTEIDTEPTVSSWMVERQRQMDEKNLREITMQALCKCGHKKRDHDQRRFNIYANTTAYDGCTYCLSKGMCPWFEPTDQDVADIIHQLP